MPNPCFKNDSIVIVLLFFSEYLSFFYFSIDLKAKTNFCIKVVIPFKICSLHISWVYLLSININHIPKTFRMLDKYDKPKDVS